MPSQARLNFEKFLLRDVRELSDLHRQRFAGRGRPQSFLTRSGIFLLCAAWELYCEDVIRESFLLILASTPEPLALPEHVRRTMATCIKNEKNELAPLRLAGDGWRGYLSDHIEVKLGQLNTPSASNVCELFKAAVAIDMTPILDPYSQALRSFISKRGDIAHRGADAGHVSINDLQTDYDFICALVVELDNAIIEPLRAHIGRRPWNRRVA